MILNTIILNNQETWPDEVVYFLQKNHNLFSLHEAILLGPEIRCEYDKLYKDLYNILLPFSLRGYHCTKLTEFEIISISNHGMQLPNLGLLSKRIDELVVSKKITLEAANRLKNENQANHKYRSNMLWFCFFYPKKAGESGIGRFFRSWGGEALYIMHEKDAETGTILRNIGIPCIIEADVPVSYLNPFSGVVDIYQI